MSEAEIVSDCSKFWIWALRVSSRDYANTDPGRRTGPDLVACSDIDVVLTRIRT